jgi:thiol-disulfide isomerase/thioredoxin
MNVTKPWLVRWALALGLASTLMVWPMGCATDESLPPDPNLAFTLKDMNGADVHLADYQGRPILVNFWATWCTPCRHEIPMFVELVEKYKAQKFTVLGISVDDKPEDLRPFAAEFKMNYPVLVGLGHDDIQEHYGAGALPVSWFIRADGTVDYKHMGTQSKQWFEDRVKRLFEPAASGAGQ